MFSCRLNFNACVYFLPRSLQLAFVNATLPFARTELTYRNDSLDVQNRVNECAVIGWKNAVHIQALLQHPETEGR